MLAQPVIGKPDIMQAERWQRWGYLGALMIAGESIYMLPYMRKTFQTSMEEVFGLGSTEIGLLNSMFGIVAFVAYFPSGWLADRFSARKLLTISLMTTGLGGFAMLAVRSYPWLLGIHLFWGATSILTFWGALIKATRDWGRADEQGRSFGLLDGGRGAVGAVIATVATTVFALSDGARNGLTGVIVVYSIAPILAGIVVWLFVSENASGEADSSDREMGAEGESRRRPRIPFLIEAMRIPQIWLLAFLIFAAYFLYLGSYEFPAYAEVGYDRSKTFGATLGTARDWMRPVAAIGAGLLADRIRASRAIGGSFVLLIVAFGSLALVSPADGGLGLLWVQVGVAALAVFALRGIYFALLEEIGIPNTMTGVTVGIVSFVGFMPDMFVHLLAGAFVDAFPGAAGYRYYFGLLAVVAVFGLVAVGALRAVKGRAALCPARRQG